MTKSPPAITELLMAWRDGRSDALDQLLPLVYEELLRAARRFMRRERHDHTLEATALVHEMYARLVDVQRIQWRDRAHFLAMAATLMRRILIEFARSRHVQKRGAGQQQRISLTEGIAPTRAGVVRRARPA